jgi:hypothetical protein
MLTAIGLTHGGSSKHSHTNNTEQHKETEYPQPNMHNNKNTYTNKRIHNKKNTYFTKLNTSIQDIQSHKHVQ